MEQVTRKNLVDTILTDELLNGVENEEQKAAVTQLLKTIRKSEHPEMHRIMDMTASLVQSTLSTAVSVAE